MIKKIWAIITLPISFFYWYKALIALSNDNNLIAYDFFCKINQTLIAENYRYFILKGLSLISLNKCDLALNLLNRAEYLIETKYLNRLNLDTFNYLKYYVYDLKIICFWALNKEYEKEVYQKKKNSLSYKLNNVEKRIIKLFPLQNKSYTHEVESPLFK